MNIEEKDIETIEANASLVEEVILRSKATAICPLTKIVDSYDIEVSYKPRNNKFIEAYSFSRYLEKYRDREVYQEQLANEIAEALCRTGAVDQLVVKIKGVHGSTEVEVIVEEECS